MSSLNVLVVGASIAGPSVAYWLSKIGARITVIERYPQLRAGGQNIDIRTVGVTVMRKIPGMEDAVRARLSGLESISFVNDQGRPFATMGTTGDADSQSIVSEFEIFRDDLSRIIFDLTKDHDRVNYVFGEQISSIRLMSQHKEGSNANDSVWVEFANGQLPAAEYDLVVACDGSTSRTRALAFDCSVREHVHPVNTWAAYYSVSAELLDGGLRNGRAHSAIGGRFVALGPDPHRNRARATFMKVHPRSQSRSKSVSTLDAKKIDDDPNDPLTPFRIAQRAGPDVLKQYVVDVFRDSGWKSEEILTSIHASQDFYASEIVQVRIPTLSHNRVVLVGDSGYRPGPTGTGTSLALAGAYVLAGEIGRHPGDVQAGLAAYEARMRPIIDDLQKIPPGATSLMAPQTARGIWWRNVLFRIVTWGMQYGKYFNWIQGLFSDAFAPDRFGLPDYEWVE